MTRLTPQIIEKAKVGHQIIPTDTLLGWLYQLGFTTRQPAGGSSHITVKPPKDLDIDPITIVKKTKKVDYQRDVARVCLLALERKDSKKHSRTVQEFSKSSGQNLSLDDQCKNPDYRIIHDKVDDKYYLQHMSFSQIVTELPGYIENEPYPFESYETYLDKRRTKLEKLLSEATENKGFNMVRYANGTIFLDHDAYPVDLHLKAFSTKNPQFTIHSELEQTFELVDTWHDKTSLFLDKMIEAHDGKQRQHPTKDKVSYDFDLYGRKLTYTFEIKSGFIPYEQAMNAFFDFNNKYFRILPRILRDTYGLEHSQNEQGSFVLKHPYFEDMEPIQLDSFDPSYVSPSEILKVIDEAFPERAKKIVEYNDLKERQRDDCHKLDQYLEQINSRINENMSRLSTLLNSNQGCVLNTPDRRSIKQCGRLQNISFSINGEKMSLKGMTLLAQKKNTYFYHFPSENLDKLEEKIKSCTHDAEKSTRQLDVFNVLGERTQSSASAQIDQALLGISTPKKNKFEFK